MAPCLWAAVNAVLRNDIIDFGRAHINQETVQNGKAWSGLCVLAQDMRSVSRAWSAYNLVCCASCVLGNFFAVLQAISTSHAVWVVMGVAESAVLLAVLLSAGMTTSAFTHEPLRAAHRLLAEAEPAGTEVQSSDLGKLRGAQDRAKVYDFIMHVQAASKIEGVSVMPGQSKCTANSALATWFTLQLLVLALAKVYARASDGNA
jgi:hypothetical protein